MKFGSILNSTNNAFYKNLVFFRIAIALFGLLHYFAIFQDLSFVFGSSSILPNEVTNLFVPKYVLTHYKLSSFLHLSDQFYGVAICFFTVLFSIFLATGFLTQLSALILLALHIALIKNNVFFNYGVDYYHSLSLFLLCFLPSATYFSLDATFFKRRMEKFRAQINLSTVQLMMRVFMCIAYFFSGFDKLLGYNWRNGEAIWTPKSFCHLLP